MKRFIFISSMLIACLQVGCSQSTDSEAESALPPNTSSRPPLTPKELAMVHPEYIENYTMTEKDKQQFIVAIQTLSKLLAQQITLEQATPIIGEGEFSVPKMPNKPITYYHFGSRIPKDPNKPALEFGVSGGLGRVDEQSPFYTGGLSPWTKAENTLFKFSEDDYTKKLGLKFIKRVVLADLTLEELIKRDNDPESLHDLTREQILNMSSDAEYYFELMINGQRLSFIFYVSGDKYNSKELKYPNSFDGITIINETLKDPKIQAQMSKTVRFGDICPMSGMWYCKEMTDEKGIYLLKGNLMPGQPFTEAEREREPLEWHLIKPVSDV
jgi:hypothetical protein